MRSEEGIARELELELELCVWMSVDDRIWSFDKAALVRFRDAGLR